MEGVSNENAGKNVGGSSTSGRPGSAFFQSLWTETAILFILGTRISEAEDGADSSLLKGNDYERMPTNFHVAPGIESIFNMSVLDPVDSLGVQRFRLYYRHGGPQRTCPGRE